MLLSYIMLISCYIFPGWIWIVLSSRFPPRSHNLSSNLTSWKTSYVFCVVHWGSLFLKRLWKCQVSNQWPGGSLTMVWKSKYDDMICVLLFMFVHHAVLASLVLGLHKAAAWHSSMKWYRIRHCMSPIHLKSQHQQSSTCCMLWRLAEAFTQTLPVGEWSNFFPSTGCVAAPASRKTYRRTGRRKDKALRPGSDSKSDLRRVFKRSHEFSWYLFAMRVFQILLCTQAPIQDTHRSHTLLLFDLWPKSFAWVAR